MITVDLVLGKPKPETTGVTLPAFRAVTWSNQCGQDPNFARYCSLVHVTHAEGNGQKRCRSISVLLYVCEIQRRALRALGDKTISSLGELELPPFSG